MGLPTRLPAPLSIPSREKQENLSQLDGSARGRPAHFQVRSTPAPLATFRPQAAPHRPLCPTTCQQAGPCSMEVPRVRRASGAMRMRRTCR